MLGLGAELIAILEREVRLVVAAEHSVTVFAATACGKGFGNGETDSGTNPGRGPPEESVSTRPATSVVIAADVAPTLLGISRK